MNFFSDLFKITDDADYISLIINGAVLIDVRTNGEYNEGHSSHSINVPLDDLKDYLPKLDKNKPVIVVCQSGLRSKNAKSILKQNGFDDVYNGGTWSDFK